MRLVLSLSLVALVFGCGESIIISPTNGCDNSHTFDASPPLELNSERPANVFIPGDYDPEGCYPLVILLHGFGVSGALEDAYLGTSKLVTDKQYVLVTPDGTMTMGDSGPRFWNAAPNTESSVDDVGYILSLIDEAKSTYHIDDDRIYLFGHSNGGFMSFYMTCEASEMFTGFATLAGAPSISAEDCGSVSPAVSILSIHGTEDGTVPYDGGEDYPGALDYMERYAGAMGCDTDATEEGDRLDLNTDLPVQPDPPAEQLPPEETSVLRYTDCPDSAAVELWTMEGGVHIPPNFSPDFTSRVLDWLFSRSRAAAD